MQAELMGAQDQIAFKRQLLFSFSSLLMFIPRSCFCFLPCILCLPLPHFFFSSSPLWALINTLSTFSSSLKIPSISLRRLSSFLVSVFPPPHISLLLPPSLRLLLPTSLFSLSHSVIPNYLSSHSLLLSSALSPFICLPCLFSSSASIPLSLIHSFVSSRVPTVLRGVFVVMVKVVLSPQVAFISVGPHTHLLYCAHTKFKMLTQRSGWVDFLEKNFSLRAVKLSKYCLECSKLVFYCESACGGKGASRL